MGPTRLKKVGKYDVLEMIGRGGMGVVFKATDPFLGRTVAIKMMTTGFDGESDLLKRFYREAQSTANLHHPNIVTVYDLGDHEGNPYLVMEFLEGESLDGLISSRRELSIVEKLGYVVQVCQGLGYAHERQIIHRDIKPANIMVLRNGAVKLVDFGIARIGTDHFTRQGQMLGSVHYMSPEQIGGRELDARTDIFSAGIVLYQALTYSLPFHGKDTIATLMKIINDAPPPLSDFLSNYPLQLEEIVVRALAKSEEERYQTADEFAFDLMQVQGELRHEQLSHQVEEAVVSLEAGELRKAREQLLSVLKIEPQHTRANELLREVYHRLQKQQRGEMARQLRKRVEEALANKDLEEALRLAEQAVSIDTDPSLVALRDSVLRAKEQADRLRTALRNAQSAHNAGDLDEAMKSVEDALAIDNTNERALKLQEQLRNEVVARQKQEQVNALISDARNRISSREYTGALEVLRNVETLSEDSPVLRQLIEVASAGRERERRRKELERIYGEIESALQAGDHDVALEQCQKALSQYPSDSRLQKLQESAERERDRAELRRKIDRQLESARNMLDTGKAEQALDALQGALGEHPGDTALLSLATVARDTVARQRVERRKLEIQRSARELLRQNKYDDAIAKLEAGREELATSDFDELLQLARDEAAARAREERVKAITSDARAKIQREEFDDALKLLVESETELQEPLLRALISEARSLKAEKEERERREAEARAAEERAAEERERQHREEEARIAAERERLRLETEKRAEEERLRREAEARAAEERERQRREEQARIAAEQERLRLEAKKRAEEERQRQEAEARAAEERERQRREEEARIAAEQQRIRAETEKRAAEMEERKKSADAERESRPAEPVPPSIVTPMPSRRPEVRPHASTPPPKPSVAVPDTVLPQPAPPKPVLVPDRVPETIPQRRSTLYVIGAASLVIVLMLAWALYRGLSRDRLVQQAIFTNPEGASISWDNGKGSCVTPNCRLDVPPGKHSIRVEHEGFQPLERAIDVQRGAQPLVLPLTPIQPVASATVAPSGKGAIDVHTVPDAAVSVNGNRVGQAGADGRLRTDVDPGTHTISAEKEGYVAASKAIRVREKEERGVTLTLKQTPESVSSTTQAREEPNGAAQTQAPAPVATANSQQAQPPPPAQSPVTTTPSPPTTKQSQPVASAIQPPSPPSPEQLWADLKESNDVARLREFRDRYPNSSVAGAADKRIEQVDWDRVKESNNPDQLQAFLDTHSAGAHADEARRRIGELRSPKPTGADDLNAIRQTLDKYRAAYEQKDANLLAQIWPAIQKKQLRDMQDFFRTAQDVQVTLTPNGDADVKGDTAAVKCAFSLRFSMEGKPQQPMEKNIVMRLRKANGAWVVESVR